jgi:hypothetical protein
MLPMNSCANDISDFNNAKQTVADAKYEQDFDLTVSSLKKLIICADKINRIDIVIWQYDNLSYFYIKEFQDRTGYLEKMDILSNMKKEKDRINYISNLRINYKKEFKLIQTADQYIKISKQMETLNPNKDRDKAIESNDNFIKFIYYFLNIRRGE